ncbi:MAG: hypothetical protein ABR503_00785 [Chitinophagaceae bacterium]
MSKQKSTTMAKQDPIDYVSGLEMSFPSAKFETTRSSTAETKAVKAGEEQAFLADKSVISFVSEVSEQNRKDVLNSTLLAQMAANKKFPNEGDMLKWYEAFIEVLSKIGWNIENAEVQNFEDTKNVFEVENVIIDILTSAFGGTFAKVILKTLESLKSMSSNDKKILAFEKNTHTVTKGCFQIALAVEKNNSVSMQLGTFLLTTNSKIKQILFFKSSKDKTRLQYTSRRGTLNSEVYSDVRTMVQQKLGKSVNEYVAEIDI